MTALPEVSEPVLARLEHNGLMIVRGADAPTFLQGQLTCDVIALSPGRCLHGGYCSAKGRLLATFLIWRVNDDFRLLVSGGQQAVMQKQLSKFILRSKVVATDASADYLVLAVSGKGATDAVRETVEAVPGAPYDVSYSSNAHIIHLPVGRYLVVVAAAHAQAVIRALSEKASCGAIDEWNRLDIRAGIPEITSRTQEEFVPQMVNLDLLGGVSFTKGCYTGQEIVARMHYLGRLKQRMYLVHAAADAAPQPGDKLYSTRFGDQSCGTIVRAAPSRSGGYDALAVMQIEEARDGNVHWRAVDGPTLSLLDLPYALATP